MTRPAFFRQCLLVRPIERGELQTVSWIPEQFAVIGNRLRLRREDGWEDGWVVQSVGFHRVADDALPDPHQDVKRHRRATGDALPKS
jgi:hypothetical protein